MYICYCTIQFASHANEDVHVLTSIWACHLSVWPHRNLVIKFSCATVTPNLSFTLISMSSDLFGMVKWPFWGLKWPPTTGWKGHGLNHLVGNDFNYLLFSPQKWGRWTHFLRAYFSIGVETTNQVFVYITLFLVSKSKSTFNFRYHRYVPYIMDCRTANKKESIQHPHKRKFSSLGWQAGWNHKPWFQSRQLGTQKRRGERQVVDLHPAVPNWVILVEVINDSDFTWPGTPKCSVLEGKSLFSFCLREM